MVRDITAQMIADALKKRIEAGEWPRQGTEKQRRFLTREQIKIQYGTTFATVDAVIRILRVQGQVVTRPGGGTFIRPPRPYRVPIPSSDEGAVWTFGEPVRADMNAFSWIKDELGLTGEDTVFRVRRILKRDEDVYAVADTYAAQEENEVGLPDPTGKPHRARVWLPSDEEAQILGMPQEVPVVAMLNRVEGGVAVRVFPGDRVELDL